ncbi:gamma-aminobutyric acid type B receptor subunit 2-like [Rhopilema esculentum]|uniref:gamma-aminobutyric acid type B receptor subunit 2-like n=1 Tax=Rhopilema esculentum TaxID=499914 RepID=UPI0031E22AA6
MLVFVFMIAVLVSRIQASGTSPQKKSLSIGCFIPSYANDDHFGYTTAIEMARDWINDNHVIPDNYTIELDIGDTMEMAAYAIQHLGLFMQDKPKKVAFLGPVFTKALQPIAEALQVLAVPQISFGSTYAYFNNLLEFPYFFRTVPSTEMFNWARIHLFSRFNWKRFGLIYDRDDAPLALASSLLHKSLTRYGSTVVGPVGVSRWDSNIEEALMKFKEENIRIFIGDFLSLVARKVFCAAHRLGLFGKKYVWVIHGNIRDRLKKEDFRITCKASDIISASNNAITIGQLNFILTNETTVTGETRLALYERYVQTAKSKKRFYRTYSPYAFDALVSLGLVIRDTFHVVNWTNMDYSNHTAALAIKAAFRRIKFHGLTGLVQYNERSERLVDIAIQQVKDGKEELVATFDNVSNELTFWNEAKSFHWPNGVTPRDRERLVKRLHKMPNWISLALITFSCLGIAVSIALSFMLIKFWNTADIKKSSPRMNAIILVGCLLCYSSVGLLGTETYLPLNSQITANWKARLWLLSSGFTFKFGSMFAKTWRIFRIITNKLLRKKLGLISNFHLYGMVGALFVIDVVFLTTWEFLDPIRVDTVWGPSEVHPSEDLRVQEYSLVCTCVNFTWWIVGILFYKGALLSFGLFLAFETRHAYPEVNDSYNIGFSVYNVTVFSVIGSITAFALRKYNQEFTHGIIGASITICTTVTLGLIFLPRVAALKKQSTESSPDGTRHLNIQGKLSSSIL